MNITYTRNGDYLIPNIIIRKTKPIGHYGRLRKAYLEMHRPILFNELVLSDKLFEHCAEIEEAARKRMELIVPKLAKQYGVTEQRIWNFSIRQSTFLKFWSWLLALVWRYGASSTFWKVNGTGVTVY